MNQVSIQGRLFALACTTAVAMSAGQLLLPTMAAADGKPTDPNEIALYQGDDRQAFLEECAREEGTVSVIAGVFGDTVVAPLTKDFNSLYPYITVEAIRMDEPSMITRVAQEARARQQTIDVLDNGPASFDTLIKSGLLTPYYTPMAKLYRPDEIGPNGYYVGVRESVAAPVYNTNLLSSDVVPKTWDDLLNPALKGKMVVADSDVLSQILVGIRATRGEDAAAAYFEALSQQDVKVYKVSVRALVDLIAGGEAPMAITAQPIHAEAAKLKGAPVDWARLDMLVAWTNSIARVKDAPHPCSAALWTDFMLDPEHGQRILSSVGYLPAAPGTPTQYTEITSSNIHFNDQVWMSDNAALIQTMRDDYFLRN